MDLVTNLDKSILNAVNPITNAINAVYTDITKTFAGTLGSLAPGSAPTVSCGVAEQKWLLEQCIQRPKVPDFAGIIDDRLAAIAGRVSDMTDPDRYIEMVCNAVSSPINTLFGDMNNKLNEAANAITTPITDSLP